jgi:site-specific DNA-methyltransferase (adenine-specific)
MEINKIYNENCLQTMARIPNETIDLTVTSPPYDNLRQYNGYSFPFEEIAQELYRITKTGGSVVWVVGDATRDFNESLTSFKQALYFQQLGFKVETMIYEKESITWNENSGRYKQNFEYMFCLSKGKPKFNPIRDVKVTNMNPRKAKSNRTKGAKYDLVIPNEITARGNIWHYASGSSTNECSEHPAVFPEQLAADHIRSWSNENDIVYDCFGGSGTTAKMAHLMKRNWILSEISSEYVQIAEKRIAPYLAQTSLF